MFENGVTLTRSFIAIMYLEAKAVCNACGYQQSIDGTNTLETFVNLITWLDNEASENFMRSEQRLEHFNGHTVQMTVD
jgi:hypothetical protein